MTIPIAADNALRFMYIEGKRLHWARDVSTPRPLVDVPGAVWIQKGRLHYRDEHNVERIVEGEPA